MTQAIRLGVSLFSYSSEYYLKRLSLDDALRKAKEAGGEAIEIVASQMMPGFPYPTKRWLHDLRARCEALELEPFCYSAHLDSGLRSDRFLTDEEKVMSTVNDIRNAYEMGASVVRTQHAISPELLCRVAPWAEKYQVKVGVEIHPPHRFDTEIWQRFLKAFRDLDTPYIGVVVDRASIRSIPTTAGSTPMRSTACEGRPSTRCWSSWQRMPGFKRRVIICARTTTAHTPGNSRRNCSPSTGRTGQMNSRRS